MKQAEESFFRQRQQLIISAAMSCFSRSGFHGASMADISRESGLGAGQIYRYFHSKEAIVSETITSIVRAWSAFLAEHLPQQHSTAAIIRSDSDFWHQWPLRERRLLLETYSEASRNEKVRDILAQEEALLLTTLTSAFASRWPQLSSQQRLYRIQLMLLLVDGVACRAFGDENSLDDTELARINAILSQRIFC